MHKLVMELTKKTPPRSFGFKNFGRRGRAAQGLFFQSIIPKRLSEIYGGPYSAYMNRVTAVKDVLEVDHKKESVYVNEIQLLLKIAIQEFEKKQAINPPYVPILVERKLPTADELRLLVVLKSTLDSVSDLKAELKKTPATRYKSVSPKNKDHIEEQKAGCCHHHFNK